MAKTIRTYLGSSLVIAGVFSGCVAQQVAVSETRQPAPVTAKNETTAPIIQISTKQTHDTPDVLVLGDSQISVSAGPAYQDFFKNFQSICGANSNQTPEIAKINFNKTASIGVRSTSLHSWTARSGAAKGSICDVDKKYGINAGTWGIAEKAGRTYVQIGQGIDYQFCKPNATAFETMFADGYYKPKLLVLAFLGNSAERWANNKQSAEKDVLATLAQIPDDTACVFLATAPVFSKEVNDLRIRGQTNVIEAFQAAGDRCSVVKSFTPKIRSEIEGNPAYFRKNKSGGIADKFHPNSDAIKKFLNYNTPAMCAAVHQQLGGKL